MRALDGRGSCGAHALRHLIFIKGHTAGRRHGGAPPDRRGSPTMTDAKLRQDVLDELEFEPRVEAEDVQRKIEQALERNAAVEARAIRVTVENGGKVVLEGKVSNWNERRAVEEAAWSAAGVKAVEDRLTIA